jgi:hypothetical protein
LAGLRRISTFAQSFASITAAPGRSARMPQTSAEVTERRNERLVSADFQSLLLLNF